MARKQICLDRQPLTFHGVAPREGPAVHVEIIFQDSLRGDSIHISTLLRQDALCRGPAKKHLLLYGEDMERARDLGGTGRHSEGQKREPRRGWRRVIRKGFSLVALLSPCATSNIRSPGGQWWVGDGVFLWAGGGGRDLEKEPKAKKAGRDAPAPWNGNYGRLRLKRMAFSVSTVCLHKSEEEQQSSPGSPRPSSSTTVLPTSEESEELVRGHSSPQDTAATIDSRVPQGETSCTFLT